jgi:hypothetical protein
MTRNLGVVPNDFTLMNVPEGFTYVPLSEIVEGDTVKPFGMEPFVVTVIIRHEDENSIQFVNTKGKHVLGWHMFLSNSLTMDTVKMARKN